MNIKDKDKVELAVMYYESGTSCKEAIEKVKALHSTDQDKSKGLDKNINEIIPPGTDIDNGEVYREDTGVTIRELI